MAMKTFAFGAMPPRAIEDREMFDAECRRMNVFYNRLIETYRDKRLAVRAVLAKHSPDLTRLEDELETLEAQVLEAETASKAAAKQCRSRKNVDPALREAVAAAKTRRREVRDTLKELRKTVRESEAAQADLEAADDAQKASANLHAGESGVFWPNKTHIRRAADQANKTSYKGELKFKSYARSDRFILIAPTNIRADAANGRPESGCTMRELYDGISSYVRIEDDPRGRPRLKSGGRRHRRERRVLVSVRVATTENNQPRFITVPVTLSGLERFSDDVLVREVRLTRRRVGLDQVWGVRFVIWYPDFDRTPHLDERMCAVDVGWRLVNGDLRVAYWRGNDGRSGEWRIPEADLGRFEEADTLKRKIDLKFNEFLPKLLEWRDAGGVADLPEDHPVREYLSHAGKWKSPQRPYELERMMRTQHVADGHPIRVLIKDYADFWVKHFRWLAHGTQQHLDWRKNLYYHFLKSLRERYDTVVIEKIDWAQFYRRPDESDDSPVMRGVRGMMRVAVPGLIHQLLDQRFPVCLKADAKLTTLRCHACGSVERNWSPATELAHTCEKCGVSWDQDDNACRNLLATAAPAVQAFQEAQQAKLDRQTRKVQGRLAAIAARKAANTTDEDETDDGEFDAGLDGEPESEE